MNRQTATNEIITSVERISSIATTNNEGAQQSVVATADLSDRSNGLNEAVSKIPVVIDCK